MTTLQLGLVLITFLGLNFLLKRFANRSWHQLFAAIIYASTFTLLLALGAADFGGFGPYFVMVITAVAAIKHGRRYWQLQQVGNS